MTREEAAAALMRDAHGLDGGAGFDPEGPEFFDAGGMGADDPQTRAGLTTLEAALLVANGASLDLDLFSQKHLDNVGLPTGLVSIGNGATLADYKEVLRYLQSNPSQIRTILITTSEANNNAPLLASMTLTPTRKNIFGVSMSNTRNVRTIQTTGDFQANRATFPLVLPLDTITFLNMKTGINGSGDDVNINLAFLIGKRVEVRKSLPSAKPLVVRPGGRGVAAV